MKLLARSIFSLFLLAQALQPAHAFIPALLFDPGLAAKADPAFDRATYDKLTKIMVDVHWDKTALRKAFTELSVKCESKGQNGKDIQFLISMHDGDTEIAKEVPQDVSIILGGCSVWDVLEYSSSQTHLIPLIHKNSVIMVPRTETRYSMAPGPYPTNVR